MTDHPPTGPRVVRSADPSLSAEANRLLTGELREIIGSDTVDVPVDRPDPAVAAHGGHRPVIADLIAARIGPVFTGATAICVVAIVALAVDTDAILVLALVVLAVTTLVVTRTLWTVMNEREHPDPDTAALLEAEGVGDPDRVMQELVDEFRPAGGSDAES